ncbi:glycosyltransferase family 2 protein [Shewanella pneumatophori]|uniref:Glycosyltransferase family 2 protein n=1 Tax=Shewanella pneumatophori TaxID=314092 RepID=A0A9X2CDT4_9GAMM|nr:glycosyltransferase family 2 protein [Shewanella pneumatophori]MCL1139578.1 glycosyltransferase family 2 protein [Shewanella pneumatophori]
MASYNGQPFIGEQISSIIKQLSHNDELIISDDGSNDGTLDIIQDLTVRDSRIKLFRGPQKGLISNFEYAIKQAQGDYIFLADQDDVWEGNKVTTILKHLENTVLVVSDCSVNDENLGIISESFFALNGSKSGLFKNMYKNSYLGCCMAFRAELLKDILPFPSNIAMHDWWIGLIAECRYSVKFIPERLIKYRRHGGNASSTAEKSRYSMFKKFSFRITLCLNLLKRYI